MVFDRERGRLPDQQFVTITSRIVTVSVRGRYQFPLHKMTHRVMLLDYLVEAFSERTDWGDVDAVLLPGGFFRIAQAIGTKPQAERKAILALDDSGLAGAAGSRLLDEVWPGVTLVIGIDSEPLSGKRGGDQLVAAWQGGAMTGLARKAFPVRDETNGDAPRYWASFQDADDPGRIVTLRQGQRALLLACYDAFAVRALHGREFVDLQALRLIADRAGRIRALKPGERDDHLRRWLAMLRAFPPDLGLVAIHEFDRPGREGYWQRHGIAGASAALKGAPIVAASHFRRLLPSQIDRSPLASSGVDAAHLWQGQRRLSQRLFPTDGFVLHSKSGNPILLARLFVASHQRNIT
ncbi:hypothetical protein [Bosea sp. PAMC 26642]|uniref:hypothetical protein n=1 Tax=Bosea sp. (strain PAMC 26642) TaxID=1792307 RepID=UPI000770185F|nr:hypothetical protein [Bosea sp. PAMC 26642]AMJ61510.1 hypothetical protein AXW83_15445 [Bosea sp. PAMC 26642]